MDTNLASPKNSSGAKYLKFFKGRMTSFPSSSLHAVRLCCIPSNGRSNGLASGSEDEKRIRRAEQRALCKRSQRQQKAKPSKQGYSQPQSSTTTTAFADQRSSSSRPISRTFGAFRKPRPSDICFACGQQGHWRSQCQINPQTRSSSSGQSFPSSSGFSGIGGK